MGEIVNFFKGMLMINDSEKVPIGLCSFECAQTEQVSEVAKPKRKREMRLSELMDNNNLE